jgi:hypothetical protein
LASCSGILGGGGDDDDPPAASTTNQVLPSTVMVTVPASLEGTAAGSLRSARSSGATAPTGTEAEAAYMMIKGGVAMMKENGSMVAMYGAVIDEVIYQNNLSPSTSPYTGRQIQLTQGLVDKMNSFGFEVEDLPVGIGETLPVPDFRYETASAPYSYSLNMTETYTYEGMTETCYTGFYWSSDKKKVKMVMSDNESTSLDTYRYTITYDGVAKTSAMIMEDENGSYTFSLKEADASAKNGAFVFFESTITYGGETWKQSGSGYADDDGGTLKVTLTSGSGITAQVQTFETSFNASNIDASKASVYSAAYAEIDADMYEEVGAAEDLSGVTTAYSMETKVVALTGVTVDNDYEDAVYTFYAIFDRQLTINGSSTVLIDGDDNVNFEASPPGNIEDAVFLGSGYGSAANELTYFLDGAATAGAPGYVYVIRSEGATNTLNYVGQITL